MAESKDVKAAEAGNEKVANVVVKETEQGFRGAPVDVDPTPNHAYTVAGVLAGEPTPETDAAQAEKVGVQGRFQQ